MNNIGIVLVTYNPEKEIMSKILELDCVEEVNKIIIVDNSDENNKISNSIGSQEFKKTEFIINNKNLGIAEALNIGFRALEKKCEWILTLDQDSQIHSNLLQKYNSYISNLNENHSVGIIGTNYIDINSKTPYKKIGNKVIEVDEVISSGSLLNVKIFFQLGCFNSNYFIDQVDNEYCYRVIKNNYKVVFFEELGMEHSLGNISEKVIFNKKYYLYNQSPIRTYYRTRNKILFMREYKDLNLTIKLAKHLVKDLMRIVNEEKTLMKLIYFGKGVVEGVSKKQC